MHKAVARHDIAHRFRTVATLQPHPTERIESWFQKRWSGSDHRSSRSTHSSVAIDGNSSGSARVTARPTTQTDQGPPLARLSHRRGEFSHRARTDTIHDLDAGGRANQAVHHDSKILDHGHSLKQRVHADTPDIQPSQEPEVSKAEWLLKSTDYQYRNLKPRKHGETVNWRTKALRLVDRTALDDESSEGGMSLEEAKLVPRARASVQDLERELHWVAHNAPHPPVIRSILSILIRDRKIKPNFRCYEALIRAQCHPELGSAANIEMILAEMDRENISLDPAIYMAVLTALTVHPSAELRIWTTQCMAAQWITPTPAVKLLLTMALIREDQLELASLEVQELQSQSKLAIPVWLHVLYLHALVSRHDFAATLQHLYTLSDSRVRIPKPTLYHILTVAASHRSYALASHIWQTYVEPMHLIPHPSLCLAMLYVAAARKDPKLAESVTATLESLPTDITHPPSSTKATESAENADSEPNQQPNPRLPMPEIPLPEAWERPPPASFDLEPIPSVPTPAPQMPAIVDELRREAGVFKLPDIERDRLRKSNLFHVFSAHKGLWNARFDTRVALEMSWFDRLRSERELRMARGGRAGLARKKKREDALKGDDAEVWALEGEETQGQQS